MWLVQAGFRLKAAVTPQTSADSAGASFPVLYSQHRMMGKLGIPLLVPLLRGRDRMELCNPAHGAAVSAGNQTCSHKLKWVLSGPVFPWFWWVLILYIVSVRRSWLIAPRELIHFASYSFRSCNWAYVVWVMVHKMGWGGVFLSVTDISYCTYLGFCKWLF